MIEVLRGSGGVVPHIFKLGILWDVAALPIKKEVLVPTETDAVWATNTFWTLWQQDKPLAPCQGLNIREPRL
jgi:hypothetical protein